jgi:hypothetical protein
MSIEQQYDKKDRAQDRAGDNSFLASDPPDWDRMRPKPPTGGNVRINPTRGAEPRALSNGGAAA